MTDISKIDMERINGLLDKFEEVTASISSINSSISSINSNIDSINSKLNSMKYVIETGQSEDNTQFYRLYNDGFIEQWGTFIIPTTGSATLTFLKSFSDTHYSLTTGKYSSDSSSWNVMLYNKTSTSITIKVNLTGYAISAD